MLPRLSFSWLRLHGSVRANMRRRCHQAERWGLLSRNVARLVDPPRVRREEVRPLTPAEAQALIAAIKGHRLEALYTVAVALGLRQAEALGLRWRDVDVDSGMLTVRNTLVALPRALRADGGRRYPARPGGAEDCAQPPHRRTAWHCSWALKEHRRPR